MNDVNNRHRSDVTEGFARAALEREVRREENNAAIDMEPPVAPIVRPPREDYVRVSVETATGCLEPAVEWRFGDSFEALAERLETLAKHIASRFPDCDTMTRAQLLGDRIAKQWPDRAYFVEVWSVGRRGFAQVFQPFGLPRNPR